MIECYYNWCKFHCKDEPFCCETDCLASIEELEQFAEKRKQFLQEIKEYAPTQNTETSK